MGKGLSPSRPGGWSRGRVGLLCLAIGFIVSILIVCTPIYFEIKDGISLQQDSDTLWWMQPYQKSVAQGPIQIKQFPYDISIYTDIALLQLVCYAGGKKEQGTFVDVGLPTESLRFADAGHRCEAFEPRTEGYESVKKKVEERGLQNLITLHRLGLSNSTGQIKIYEARDSSSIIESAVKVGPELEKRGEEGMKETMVDIAPLDDFVSEADAMKIDAQGAEPEIIMGAQKVLTSGLHVPIVMEYCARFRRFEELSVGVYILHGLGYQCYATEAFVIDEKSDFCGDLQCTKHIQERPCHITP